MNQTEIFRENLIKKIKKYEIETSLKELLIFAENKFIEQEYSNGKKEIIEIGIERKLCELSPYYFVSKYCCLSVTGTGIISADDNLYYFQKEILKQFRNWEKIVLNKCRQTGLSSVLALIATYLLLFHNNENIAIISKTQKDSIDFLKKIKMNFQYIPSWLNISLVINNITQVSFSNNSECYAYARSLTAARGSSVSTVILDELAFYGSETIVESIISSVSMAMAKVKHPLLVLCSTPNGTEGQGKYYYEQVAKLESLGGKNLKDKSILYPIEWWMTRNNNAEINLSKGYDKEVLEFERRDYFNNFDVYQEALKFFRPIEKNWKQNDFLRKQYENSSSEYKFFQEVLHKFTITGNSVFNIETLEKTELKVKTPIQKDVLNNKTQKDFWIWEFPQNNSKYLISLDVSSGTSKDSSAIEVINLETQNQSAEYLGKITTYDLADLVYNIGSYYNDGMIFIESNSIGEAVFNRIYKDLHYPNLYKIKKSSNGIERFTGWLTTSKTRELILNNLIRRFQKEEDFEELKINSSRLVSQLKNFVWKGNRMEASGSSHDDLVLSYAIGLYNISIANKNSYDFFISEDGRFVGNSSENNLSLDKEDLKEDFIQSSGVSNYEDLMWILN